jgi:hypothetical protein
MDETTTAPNVRGQLRTLFRFAHGRPALVLPHEVSGQIAFEPTITRVPNTQTWFRGVINQRGLLIPVFDLGLWCGIEHDDWRDATVLIVAPQHASPAAVLTLGQPQLAITMAKSDEIEIDRLGPLQDFVGAPLIANNDDAYDFDCIRWFARAGQGATVVR